MVVDRRTTTEGVVITCGVVFVCRLLSSICPFFPKMYKTRDICPRQGQVRPPDVLANTHCRKQNMISTQQLLTLLLCILSGVVCSCFVGVEGITSAFVHNPSALTMLNESSSEISEKERDTRTSSIMFAKPCLHLSAVLFLSCWMQIESASAVIPMSATTTFATSTPFRIADSTAFKLLPREAPLTKAVKELNDLRDLEDYRLDACAERGVFWEQCFFLGESDDGVVSSEGMQGGAARMRYDSQLLSPSGALNPPKEQSKIPTW